jgi:hypothetical protein
MRRGPATVAHDATFLHNGKASTGRFLSMGNIETMETQAQRLRQNRFSLLLARPWASRLIATLGIVVMTVGLSVPFAGTDEIFHGDPVSRYSDTWALRNTAGAPLVFLHGGRMVLPLYLGFDAVYSVLTLGGLALIPLLWRQLSPKGTARVRWTYAVWLLLLTILAVAGLAAWWQFVVQSLPGPPFRLITMGAPYLLPGAVVFPLGVLVSCVALPLMLREPMLTSAPAPAPRTGWQWIATLVLTAGALVWGIGFYLMPEAITAACPPVIFSVTQFVHGNCAGLDSDQVLQDAYYAGLNPIALLLFTLGRHFELLVAAGGITTLGGWTRQLSVNTLAWLAVWPALALGVALVALQGVGVVAQHGFPFGPGMGPGGMGPGMVVTFVGIGLVALGQLGLWRELVRVGRGHEEG